MINRVALLLRYKEPAVRWIAEADPYPSESQPSLGDVNQERTVYLIEEGAADDLETVERWLKRHYKDFFEMELDGWYTDPTLWPQDRTYMIERSRFVVSTGS